MAGVPWDHPDADPMGDMREFAAAAKRRYIEGLGVDRQAEFRRSLLARMAEDDDTREAWADELRRRGYTVTLPASPDGWSSFEVPSSDAERGVRYWVPAEEPSDG